MKNIWKIAVAGFVLPIFNVAASACPWCRAQVKSEIYDRDFFSNLFVLLLPVILIIGIGLGLYHAEKISNKIKRIK